jgi:hypothetical protein
LPQAESLPVVISAGRDADLISGDLVDEAMIVGDSTEPLAGEVVFEGHVAVRARDRADEQQAVDPSGMV